MGTLWQQRLEQLMTKYPDIVRDSIRKMADVKAHLTLKDGVALSFVKDRPALTVVDRTGTVRAGRYSYPGDFKQNRV